MRKYCFRILIPALAGVSLLLAANIKTDYDHHADFAKYKTYSWLKVQANTQIWSDRIQRAVDSELQAKGWQKVADGGDASVSAFGSTHNEQTLNTFYDGLGGGWFWRGFGPDMATTTVQNTPVGALTVDLFDSQTKHLIWRGTAEDTLSDKTEKNDKGLHKNIADMFKHFPPTPKT